MKKVSLSFYYITLFVFLQVLAVFTGVSVLAEGEENGENVLTVAQRNTIIDHCDSMKDIVKALQRTDSRARVYLGRYYETILTDFITPLNLRLVENNISNSNLLENQTKFAERRTRFINDYISYQQALEVLGNVNCRTNPDEFYEKLLVARERRQTVNRDVTRLREYTNEQVKLVEALKNEL